VFVVVCDVPTHTRILPTLREDRSGVRREPAERGLECDCLDSRLSTPTCHPPPPPNAKRRHTERSPVRALSGWCTSSYGVRSSSFVSPIAASARAAGPGVAAQAGGLASRLLSPQTSLNGPKVVKERAASGAPVCPRRMPEHIGCWTATASLCFRSCCCCCCCWS
jgi:hypothetical protein